MTMSLPDFQGATQHAIEQLGQKLPLIYTYHSIKHTCDEVVSMTERLANMEGIDGEERLLMITGAYFHDIGFTLQRDNHEMAGAHYANYVLPQYGFSPTQVKMVTGIILATRIPQRPQNLLEQIVDDADLDSLGRVDFWNRNLALRSEMAMLGMYFTDQEWCERQRGFLKQHHYFTSSAKRLRDEQKQANFNFFTERCQECCPEGNWM
jgi:uncharacterized protein